MAAMNKALLCRMSAILLCLALPAHAEIYTWIDSQGVRHYSDSPSSGQARPADLPGIQRADGNPDALARLQAQVAQQNAAQDATAASAAGMPQSRIPDLVEPEAEATFRDARGIVPVSVTINGAATLGPGEQITYYLDGSPIPQSPSDQTQLQLGNVARGTHTLSAALLYQGREIRRTEPVTFYMQPPSAISPLNGNPGTDTVPGTAIAAPAGNATGVPAAPRINSGAANAAPPAM